MQHDAIGGKQCEEGRKEGRREGGKEGGKEEEKLK
jgi:hypothetical protein